MTTLLQTLAFKHADKKHTLYRTSQSKCWSTTCWLFAEGANATCHVMIPFPGSVLTHVIIIVDGFLGNKTWDWVSLPSVWFTNSCVATWTLGQSTKNPDTASIRVPAYASLYRNHTLDPWGRMCVNHSCAAVTAIFLPNSFLITILSYTVLQICRHRLFKPHTDKMLASAGRLRKAS